VLVAAGNIGACEKTLESGASNALTSDDSFDPIAHNSIPARTLTFRADDLAHIRIVLETDLTASSSNRATGARAEFDPAW